MPAKQVEITPWKHANVDLIGPCKVQSKKNSTTKTPSDSRALTVIDPVNGWLEIKPIQCLDPTTIMDAFCEARICCYVKPDKIEPESGSKFKLQCTETTTSSKNTPQCRIGSPMEKLNRSTK